MKNKIKENLKKIAIIDTNFVANSKKRSKRLEERRRNLAPKIKAWLFVDIFTMKLPAFSDCEKINYPVQHQGKLIATMVCDEIIRALQGCHTAEEYGTYWNDVKKHIENL